VERENKTFSGKRQFFVAAEDTSDRLNGAVVRLNATPAYVNPDTDPFPLFSP